MRKIYEKIVNLDVQWAIFVNYRPISGSNEWNIKPSEQNSRKNQLLGGPMSKIC